MGHSVDVVDDFNDFYDPAIKRANVAAFNGDVAVHAAVQAVQFGATMVGQPVARLQAMVE